MQDVVVKCFDIAQAELNKIADYSIVPDISNSYTRYSDYMSHLQV